MLKLVATAALTLGLLAPQALAADALADQAERLATTLDRYGPDLGATTRERIRDLLDEADDLARGLGGGGGGAELLCFPSEAQPGKYFFALRTAPETRVGNYFADATNCGLARRVAKRGRTCFESEAEPGKAYVQLIQASAARIGNYFSSFSGCTESMRAARGDLVCMESEAQVGSWFLSDLSTAGGDRVGNYFPSREACFQAR